MSAERRQALRRNLKAGNRRYDHEAWRRWYRDGLTDAEIARRCGANAETVGRWRRGRGLKTNTARDNANTRLCVICGGRFASPPSDSVKTCSRACSTVWRRVERLGHKMPARIPSYERLASALGRRPSIADLAIMWGVSPSRASELRSGIEARRKAPQPLTRPPSRRRGRTGPPGAPASPCT